MLAFCLLSPLPVLLLLSDMPSYDISLLVGKDIFLLTNDVVTVVQVNFRLIACKVVSSSSRAIDTFFLTHFPISKHFLGSDSDYSSNFSALINFVSERIGEVVAEDWFSSL